MTMRSLFDEPFEEPRPPAAEPAKAAPRRRVFTITELTIEIRQQLEERFVDILVEGELSNCRLWNTGHYYFTLKDAGAQMKGVLFKSAARYLKFRPEDGQQVLARGRVSVYEPKGEYQFVCEHLEPLGHGALQLAIEQLKRKLQSEGLFDVGRKRPLPALPRIVGVVTSLDGAAIRDIVKVVTARRSNAHLLVRPTRVQGDGAAAEVAAALRHLARVDGVDVIIVARGGGSLEDLRAFNDEIVARAIAACLVPVVSGVGHESDVSIADLVADVRAATPSNAAELVVASSDAFTSHLRHLSNRLRQAQALGWRRAHARLQALLARPGLVGVPTRVALRGRDVMDLRHRADRAVVAAGRGRRDRLTAAQRRLDAASPTRRLATLRQRLVRADANVREAWRAPHQRADRAFRALAGRLENLSPLAVLARGYAVAWRADRAEVIRDAAVTAVGDQLHVTLGRGAVDCRVTARYPNDAPGRPTERPPDDETTRS
ncbi:MAG: exodeoxyribonuclease VII large subunit [Vicinamibacterales bacterium]